MAMKVLSNIFCYTTLKAVKTSEVEQGIIKNSTKRSNSMCKLFGGVLFYGGFSAD